eukprot:GFUD01106496.1.p1 GENE.GFUD01106496.1~~GFUD01106496.1.p1  ORF type:complete len:224 (+),score=45.05 GFUD01106496.1:1-672(+)
MFESDYYRFSKKGMLPVRWMSPESLTDGLFTPMSDIWSFGVLLYEIITFGSFPFQGLSNNQVLMNIKSGNTLTPPQGVGPLSSELLKRCWSKDPEKRPNASEILEIFSYSPRLISPSIDVPTASVQMDRSISFEGEHRNSDDKSYSPMTGPIKSPLHEELLMNKHENSDKNSEEEKNIGRCSPFAQEKISYDSDLIGSYVESGYLVCNSVKLSNSVYSSRKSL